MQIERARHRGDAVVVVQGEVDIADVADIEAAVQRAAARSRHGVVADLRGVSFIDCSGLGAFLAAREALRSRGLDLILVATDGPVTRLLRLTGIDGEVCVVRNVSELEWLAAG